MKKQLGEGNGGGPLIFHVAYLGKIIKLDLGKNSYGNMIPPLDEYDF